jgi:hypothetical protein
MSKRMKRRLLILGSFCFLTPVLLLTSFGLIHSAKKSNDPISPSQRFILGETTVNRNPSYVPLLTDLYSQPKSVSSETIPGDARPVIVKQYLEKWNSPMSQFSDLIVSESDQNGVDPMLVVAIAQQESNLGKKVTPGCYNAWGWAQTSVNTRCFKSWEDGIISFIDEFSESYIQKGLSSPEQIMTRYNATSPGGSWARGVSQFLEDLSNPGSS